MVTTLPFQLDGDSADRTWPIFGDVYLPFGEGPPAPVVALAHGFFGHKDGGGLPELGRELAGSGIVAVAFSFSGSGVPRGASEILDEQKFGANTFAREVDDLGRVVTAIFERMLPGRERFDIRRIGVLGCEAGGAVALIEAARDSRVRAVAGACAPPRLEAVFDRDAFEGWEASGEARLTDPRTCRKLFVGREMLRDIRARAAAPRPGDPPADVRAAVAALPVPVLILHGEKDLRYAVTDAKSVFFAGGPDVELEIVPDLDAAGERAPASVAPVRAAALRFFERRLAVA